MSDLTTNIPAKQREKMAARGYIPPVEAAQKLGCDPDSIYRLIRAKRVKAQRLGYFWYVEVQSLVAYYGVEAAALLGILPEPPASGK